MILLDTNVVSEPLRPRPDRAVLGWLDAQVAESLFLATVSLAELLLGIAGLPQGRRRKALGAALDQQIIGLFGDRILPFDVEAAVSYADLVTHARSRGFAIAMADAQIAAIAASRRFSVATRDEAPFRAAGVAVVNPWTASGGP